METFIIEVTDQRAFNLLKELELLQLIRIIKNEPVAQKSFSEKYYGKISFGIADDLLKHITQSRNEWERNIY